MTLLVPMQAAMLRALDPYHRIRAGVAALFALSVVVMAVGVPLALGSWLGLLVLVLTSPVLVLRVLDEEKLL